MRRVFLATAAALALGGVVFGWPIFKSGTGLIASRLRVDVRDGDALPVAGCTVTVTPGPYVLVEIGGGLYSNYGIGVEGPTEPDIPRGVEYKICAVCGGSRGGTTTVFTQTVNAMIVTATPGACP